MPRENILVNIVHHPIEARNVTVVEVPFHRQSLEQLKSKFVPGQEVIAALDKKQVEFDACRYTYVMPGSEVVFIPAAAGPLASFFAWDIGFGVTLGSIAVSMGLAYLGGLLFGPDVPEAKHKEEGQSYSWEPHTTQREGMAHPVCFGTNQHYGNIVARWTDVDATGDEVIYMILDYGEGPIQGIVSGKMSDENHCLGGTPTFNMIYNFELDAIYSTAANINDDNRTSYVGFYGEDHPAVIGEYEAIVEFDNVPQVDRVDYYRYWRMTGKKTHVGYEKVYLYYGAAWHLINTRNYTSQGSGQGILSITNGGPWYNVTKVKVVARMNAQWYSLPKKKAWAEHKIFEIRVWELGENPVYLNDQPARNFPEVTVQGRLGTLNQTCMKGFEKNKLEYRQVRSKITNDISAGGPVTWTSPNKFFDDLEYTLEWPRGIYRYKSSGSKRAWSIGVKVEISVRNADSWTTLMDTTITGGQLEPIYKAYKVSEQGFDCIHGVQYDLRFSKTTADSDNPRYQNETWIRSVREVVNVAFTRPGKALLGITAVATARLSGHIDVKWVSDDKLVNTYNTATSTWEIKFSRNRSWVTLAELTQPVISGDGGANPWAIELYEGINPSRIDLAFFLEWALWCDQQVPSGVGVETEARMPCDIICDRQTNVWNLAYEICQVGRMTPYWQGNILTGWIDKAVDEDEVIDLITMDNTMLRSWGSGWAGHEEKAGNVEVFFRDKLHGYERKPRPVSNENAGLYTRVVAIEGVGVTGHALATRVGNFALNRNKLITNYNSTKMFVEALRYRLGKVVRLQSNVPNWGESYRVVGCEADNTVELDRLVDAKVGDIFWVRSYDEANKKVVIKSYTVESFAGAVLTIVETWDVTPSPNNIAAIGMAGAIKLRRIIKMRHSSDNFFFVELETYDATLFESDGWDPVLENADYWCPQPAAELARPVTRSDVIKLIQDIVMPQPGTDIPWTSNCDWTGNDVDTITWAALDSDDPIVFRFKGIDYEITPDNTTDEFVIWDPNFPDVFSTTTAGSIAAKLAAGCWVVCTNEDGVPHPAVPVPLMHAAILQAGTITAAYGQIAALTIGTAEIINAAITQAKIANLAVGTAQIQALAVTAAKIGALAVETAKIKDLAVETVKINNLAVTTPKIAAHAATQEYGELTNPGSLDTISSSGTTICGPIEIATTGGDVKLSVTVYYGATPTDDDFWCFFRKDDVQMEPAGFVSVTALAAWPDLMCYTREYRVTSLAADTYEFTVKAYCTDDDAVIGQRFFTVQELKK